MLKKLSSWVGSDHFGYALGIVFMLISLFENGVQSGVTFLTGIIICSAINIERQIKLLHATLLGQVEDKE